MTDLDVAAGDDVAGADDHCVSAALALAKMTEFVTSFSTERFKALTSKAVAPAAPCSSYK